MFLRRAFVEGRRSALRLSARPACLFHSRVPLASSGKHAGRPARSPQTHLQAAAPEGDTSVQEAIDAFHSAVTTQPGRPLRAAYDDLIAHLDSLHDFRPAAQPGDQHKLRDALLHIVRSQNREDYDMLADLVRRIARLSDMEVDEYADDVFSRLVFDYETSVAYTWLDVSVEILALAYVLRTSRWQALLQAAAELRDQMLVEKILRRMDQLQMARERATPTLIFNALFRGRRSARFYRPPRFTTVQYIITLLRKLHYPYDADTLSVIINGYTRSNMEELAKDAEAFYLSMLGDRDHVSQGRFIEVLADQSKRKGRDVAARTYRRFAQMGLTPSDTTLRGILGDSSHLGDLKYWERVLGVKATPRVITTLMERRAEGNAPVTELYDYALSSGIPLTATMLHLLIKPMLTSRGVEKPTEKLIDRALERYREFVAHNEGREASTELGGQGEDAPSRKYMAFQPNPSTYQLLLRTLTAAKNVTKYFPIAISLVEDMQRFKVRPDSQTAASLLVLLMSTAPPPEDAFHMYRLIAVPKNPADRPILNEEGYVAVLDTFCKLPTWPDGIPSTKLYFEVLSDMRKYGIRFGPKVYTVLLAQMAKLATAAAASDDPVSLAAVAKAISRVHNHITVAPAFTPDTALWNQLMDAYQRAGCFAEAVRIWQTLFASAQFNAASVSIILDACAYARAYDMAVRVYSMLNEVGFPMSVKNWNTYLECLCRVGRLDEAIKVLCLEMTGRDDGVEPNKESLRIVLKFASKANQEAEVRSRLRRFLPKLYYLLISET